MQKPLIGSNARVASSERSILKRTVAVLVLVAVCVLFLSKKAEHFEEISVGGQAGTTSETGSTGNVNIILPPVHLEQCAFDGCKPCIDEEVGPGAYGKIFPAGLKEKHRRQLFSKNFWSCILCCAGDEDRPPARPPIQSQKEEWKEDLMQMHNGGSSAYFWGWTRETTKSDISGLLKKLLEAGPTSEKDEILIYSGTHGDKEGRFDLDARTSAKCSYQVPKFAQEDLDSINSMKSLNGWKVTVKTEPEMQDFTNLLRILQPSSKYKHIIWGFCYSADTSATNHKTVTQRVIAMQNFGLSSAMKIQDSMDSVADADLAWTKPDYVFSFFMFKTTHI